MPFPDTLSPLGLAWRSLRRSPAFLVTATLTLGIATGAAIAAFAILDAVRFRDLPFAEPDRLVVIQEVPAEGAVACPSVCDVSWETYADVLRPHAFRSLNGISGFTAGGKLLSRGADEPFTVSGSVVAPEVFQLLRVRAAVGRVLTAEDDRLESPLVTVLSHDLWTRAFAADPSVIGTVIRLSDSQYTVVGVMPPGFRFESEADFWLPTVPTLHPSTSPSIRSLNVVARLAPGASLAQLRSELALLEPAPKRGALAAVKSRLDASLLRQRYVTATQSRDLFLAGIVACVLLIACANLASLAFVRALSQQREVAVRIALGAAAGRLARHVLIQNAIVAALGVASGLVVSRWLLSAARSMDAVQGLRAEGMESQLDARAVWFAVLLAAVIAVALTAAPWRLLVRHDVQAGLREGSSSATPGRASVRTQQGFVVLQVAASAILLTVAGMMVQSVRALSRLPMGYRTSNLAQVSPSFPHPWRVKERYLPVVERMTADLGAVAGVREVAVRALVPLGAGPQGASAAVSVGGATLPPALQPSVSVAVSPNYFRALEIPLRAGASFSDADLEASAPVGIVNEWAARRWFPGGDAVGQVVRVDTAPGAAAQVRIVGVVADNLAATGNVLVAREGAEWYRPYVQSPSWGPSFLVRFGGSAPAATAGLQPLRMLLRSSVPNRPGFVGLVQDNIDRAIGTVRTSAWQIVAFAAIGVVLAMVGLYGVMSHATQRRTREMGVRVVLGATRPRLAAMVLADALRLTAVGLGLGLIGARWGVGVFRALLYGAEPMDGMVYGAVALVLLAVSALAAYVPARRAGRVDPVRSLRVG